MAKNDKDKKKPEDESVAPPPVLPPKKSVSKPADPVAATGVKAGFDPMRPFRYAWGFVTGTVTRGLDGISSGTRKGMMFGAIGFLALAFLPLIFPAIPALLPALMGGMANNVLWVAATGALAGGMAGGVLGGAVGVATGGAKAVGRLHRAEKYADDLLEKQKAKKVHRPADGPDFRDYYKAHQERRDYLFDRTRQIQMEQNRDSRTYWQDRIHGERSGGMGGQGQGF